MIRARATFTAMLIVTVFAVGCDFVSSPEAQAVVDSTREAVQSIDKAKVQPRTDTGTFVPEVRIDRPVERSRGQKPEIRGRQVPPRVVEPDRPGRGENPMAGMMREFETRFHELDQRQYQIDEESDRLMRRFEEEGRRIEEGQFEAVRELEAHWDYLYGQLGEVYVSADPVMEQLYVELDAVIAELDRDEADPETREMLVHEADALKKEIAGREEMVSAQTQAIEEEMFKVEHELDRLYREIEVHYVELEDDFSRAMSRLDEERFALEDKRRMLEDEARYGMERLYSETDNARNEAERRLREVLTDAPRPTEGPTFTIKGEIEVKNAPLPDVESAFNEVRDTVEPLLKQAEEGVSALLKAAIESAADESSAATESIAH